MYPNYHVFWKKNAPYHSIARHNQVLLALENVFTSTNKSAAIDSLLNLKLLPSECNLALNNGPGEGTSILHVLVDCATRFNMDDAYHGLCHLITHFPELDFNVPARKGDCQGISPFYLLTSIAGGEIVDKSNYAFVMARAYELIYLVVNHQLNIDWFKAYPAPYYDKNKSPISWIIEAAHEMRHPKALEILNLLNLNPSNALKC